MSKRSVVAGLGLMAVLGACGKYGPTQAYSAPGWYLEKPRMLLAAGPEMFAGPMTYDECEAKRVSYPAPAPASLICVMEKTKPGIYGPYTPSSELDARARRSS